MPDTGIECNYGKGVAIAVLAIPAIAAVSAAASAISTMAIVATVCLVAKAAFEYIKDRKEESNSPSYERTLTMAKHTAIAMLPVVGIFVLMGVSYFSSDFFGEIVSNWGPYFVKEDQQGQLQSDCQTPHFHGAAFDKLKELFSVSTAPSKS